LAAPSRRAKIGLGIIQGNMIVTGSWSAQIGPSGLNTPGLGHTLLIEPGTLSQPALYSLRPPASRATLAKGHV
jgi:hypothetical protein